MSGFFTLLLAVLASALPSSADEIDPILGDSAGAAFDGGLGRVYSLLDYFESGRRAVQVYVANAPRGLTEPRLGRTIDNAARVVVRVEIRFPLEKANIAPIYASGVLVDRGRRVLTASAGFENLPGRHEVLITLPDGDVRRAEKVDRVRGGADGGWAILDIVGGGFRDAPDVDMAEPRDGGIAIVLGYPDQIGINAAGNVAFPTGKRGEVLRPITTLGTIAAEDGLTLEPTAGAIPTTGMNGAPVFDTRGRLLGIIVAIARKDRPGQPSYAFHAAPVRSVKRQLKH